MTAGELRVQRQGQAVRFTVHVQPRASRSEVAGVHGDALKVRLCAPPVDGAANDALVELLARLLAVGKRAVRIVAGASSRAKLVEVDGITEEQVVSLARDSSRT